MTTIYYNEENPFEGLAPTPFVGRTSDMIQVGDRWGQLETFRLRGLITGKCDTFEEAVEKQQTLIYRFNEDFQYLSIYDEAELVVGRNHVKVTDITFDQSNYAYGIPFTVTLQSYPQAYFSGVYGVLDPKDEFSYSEQEDGTLNITHTISARGFPDAQGVVTSLTNAKEWVQARQGLAGAVPATFISSLGLNSPCLVTSAESVNRLTSAYEIKETYTSDLLQAGFGILRYSVEYDYDYQDGRSIINVKGEVAGCKNGTMAQTRTRYQQFNAYQEAVNHLRRITGRVDLNTTPVTKGLSEDPQRNRLSFTFTFNDDLTQVTWFEYKVDFDYDYENDLISASIDGVVKSRAEISTRWGLVSTYASTVNLYALIKPHYDAFVAANGFTYYPLNTLARSYSKTENKFSYEINLSAKYNNGPVAPYGLSVWDYTVDITPALHQYADVPCLDGFGVYTVFDLGFKTRKLVSIEGRAVGSSGQTPATVEEIAKTQVLLLKNQHVTSDRANLDSQSISHSNSVFGLNAGVTATYSCDDLAFTI